MTPAINLLKAKKVTYTLHEYKHDPAEKSYGLEAVAKLGVPAERVFKTLVVELQNKQLAVGVIPVQRKLNMKSMAQALGAKKADMAAQKNVERSTGYVLGGVSPLGQKKPLKTLIDASAAHFASVFVSAGKRGLEIELSPKDLLLLVNGALSDICL